MKTETPQIVNRQDYTPPPYLVDSVELDVRFHTGEVLVNSHLRLRRNPAAAPGQALQLDGHELETMAMAIDGTALAEDRYTRTDSTLTIARLPDALTLSTQTRIDPDHNTCLLYTSRCV